MQFDERVPPVPVRNEQEVLHKIISVDHKYPQGARGIIRAALSCTQGGTPEQIDNVRYSRTIAI